MSRPLREAAGMTAAWTVIGMVFAASAVATVAVGVLYACAAGFVSVQTASKSIRRNSKGRNA